MGLHYVRGHGRLMDPPSRASMWRVGFSNPADYNDNEGFCGGSNVQWNQNEGRCGICGDNWADKVREHETPNRYANGISQQNTVLTKKLISQLTLPRTTLATSRSSSALPRTT